MGRNKAFYISLLLIAFIASTSVGLSQSSFEVTYSSDFDEFPVDGIELSDGSYLIAAIQGDFSTQQYHCILLKINPYGDTIQSLIIEKEGKENFIGDLVRGTNGSIFCVGKIGSSMDENLWLLNISEDLNILFDTSYSLGLFNLTNYFGFTNWEDNLILFGTGGLYDSHPFIFRLTQMGDSLQYSYLEDSGNEIAFSMHQKPDSSGYIMAIYGHYQVMMSNAGQLLTLDTLLNVINIDSIPLFLSLYYNIMYPDFEHLYLTGHLTVPFSNPRTDLLVIMRMDSSKVILDTAYLGPADTINYPGYLKNLDFVDLSNLYFGGTCNQALGTFSTNKSYYLLGKLSPSLDILWQKFYGGDMYYNLWSLLATSDHGCILMGSFNDYATMGMQRDMLIIKVDSTGVLTSVQGNDNLVLHDLIAYPNPGQDRLILEFGPQVSGSDFVLSDLNGKEVLVIKLNNSPQIVDAQKLKQGLYVWKVLSRGNLVDSGKWIKKE